MSAAKKLITTDFLTAKKWEALYGEGYEKWRNERWTSSSRETQEFLNHILPLGRVEGEKRLLPHQAEAVLRTIYSYENTDLRPVMTTLATGTGKTLVIATVISWLRCINNINTFILFCPNTIVRDRLKKDFIGNAVFEEFKLFPHSKKELLNTLNCSVVDSYQQMANLRGYNLIVANRHQFQQGYSGGQDHLTFMYNEGGNLALFNDEAHNTRGKEYTRTLKILEPNTSFRLDLTATPDRADNLRPECHEIYNLSVVEAITGSYKNNDYIQKSYEHYPRLIKDVVVQRPDIKTLGAVSLQDLVFRDAQSGQQLTVREIDWEELPRKKNLQLVMDPGCMKMQLHLSVEALNLKKEISKDRYKPLLFVIAPSIHGAKQAVEMMKSEFGLNPLLVVDDEVEYDKQDLRDAAATLGSMESPYDSVVSVYMLREGWDVPEVSVITLLRGFGSPLFAHQVLGRGLRLIRKAGLEKDTRVQELTVIDHPALMLDDLWAEIDALVKEGDDITRDREISREGTGKADDTEEETWPEQKLVREDLYHMLFPVPDPKPIDTISIERALELLTESLVVLKEYKPEDLVFIEVEIEGVRRFRPKRAEEASSKEFKVTAIPEFGEDIRRYQREVTDAVMAWAEEMAERYEPFTNYENVVYKRLLSAIEEYLCANSPVTEVSPRALYAVSLCLPQVKESVFYELNHRIYSEELIVNG